MTSVTITNGSGATAPDPASATGPVLDVAGLSVSVRGEDGEREVVSNLSLTLARGETLCIAGESGSGKSMTALAIMQLLPQPAARISSGTIRLGNTDLTALDERRMRRIRLSPRPARSISPSLIRPTEIRAAGCGRSCMIASAVIDLPDPDSPAMHSVSPRARLKDRSETTSRSPSSPRTVMLSPATSSTEFS